MQLTAAPAGPAILERARLLASITRDAPARIAIVAPAGFGKSILAGQIARTFRNVVVCNGASPDGTVIDALENWAGTAASTLLLVDNAELLSTVTRELVAAAVTSERHVIICSRTPVELPATRFTPPASSLTLTEADLRFTQRDILTLFAGTAADDHRIAAVCELSRGWPLLIGLFYRAWRAGRLEALLADPGHAEFKTIADYVDEEILRELNPEMLAALCAGVAFERPTAREVAAALQSDIETAARLLYNLPMTSFDGTMFDVHPIVRATVRDRHAHLCRTLAAQAFNAQMERRFARSKPATKPIVIRLLDGDVECGGTTISLARKEFALLAFLSLRSNATDRDVLIEELWPQNQPADSLGALRVCVTKIRKRLGAVDVIVAENNRYRLGNAITTDLAEIRTLLAHAERRCDAATAAELVAAGESLLAGLPTFLADYPASARLTFELDRLIERTNLLLDRLCAASAPAIASQLWAIRKALRDEVGAFSSESVYGPGIVI